MEINQVNQVWTTDDSGDPLRSRTKIPMDFVKWDGGFNYANQTEVGLYYILTHFTPFLDR